MAFKKGTKGCVFHLYHAPTGLQYVGAFSFRNATHHTILWVSFFTNNPAIQNLVKLFGAHSFKVTVRKLFPTRNEAIDHLKRFYRKVKPQLREDWIADQKFPMRRSYFPSPRSRVSRKGSNNLNYGRKASALTRFKNVQGQKMVYQKRRWAVDPAGNEHHLLSPYTLLPGWRYGRNYRRWSKWVSRKGIKQTPEHIRNKVESKRLARLRRKAEERNQIESFTSSTGFSGDT